MSRKPKIVILRSNPVDPDPRVEKTADTLSSIGDIVVLARDRTGKSKRNAVIKGASIKRVRLTGTNNALLLASTLALWWCTVFLFLLVKRFDIIHACDFDTYFPAVFAAKLKRLKIVYDIFDFYADTFPDESLIHRTIAGIDRKLIGCADLVILVDPARKKQIEPAKPKKIIYIYNIPDVSAQPAGTETDRNAFFYAGMLTQERMINEILDVFTEHPHWNVALAGWGPLEGRVEDCARQFPNIKFMGRIDYNQVIEGERRSSLILAFYDPAIPNHKFASPNKLFEAIALGKPILTNRGTAMAELVMRKEIGELLDYGDKDDLVRKIKLLQEDQRLYNRYSNNCRKLANEAFNWPEMARELLRGYKGL